MRADARVLVIGAVNVDLVVAADRLPGPGETVLGAGVQSHGGGKGANAAVAAARAGAQVRYCGAVGDDDTGIRALEELRAEGIDITDVTVVEGVSTGTALIVVAPGGENQIAVGAGANAFVAPDAVHAAVRRAADWAGCVLISTEISAQAVAAAVQSAADHGLRCVLNTAPVSPELAALLPLAPIVTPNTYELNDLYRLVQTGQQSSDSATITDKAVAVAAQTTAPLVVTLGSDGVLVVDADGSTTAVPALFTADVRDATGAGDTFNGVLATALAEGKPLVAASIRGTTAASLSVRSVGARAGMPSRAAIDAALTPAE